MAQAHEGVCALLRTPVPTPTPRWWGGKPYYVVVALTAPRKDW